MNDEEIIKTFKGNLVDYIEKLKETVDKVNQLQFNWNSLREWVQSAIYETLDKYEREALQDVLDKMNELEGKKNE